MRAAQADGAYALEADGHAFAGNVQSGVLLVGTCDRLPSEKNQAALEGFAQGMDAGYKPCGECLYWVSEDGTSVLAAEAAQAYIVHVKSRKFHLGTCPSLLTEKNRAYFETRAEAFAQGYDPCGRCNP